MKKIKLKKINLGFDIDIGAPIPIVLSSEQTLFLLFYKEYQEDNEMMLLKFERHLASKFDHISCHSNIEGHPLCEYGLEEGGMYEVINSIWIEELKEIESHTDDHHSSISNSEFKEFKHYIIPFHDSTFECIAKSFKIEEIKGKTMRDMVIKTAKLLI